MEKKKKKKKKSKPQNPKPAAPPEKQEATRPRPMLARSNARHVVVLRQSRQVSVQLLDALLVGFGASFALEAFV